ncbi:MAG: hypothetical protein PHG79_10575 [Methanosarcina sp.]|jgi:hypothetical protein|nr:hypothetical protein [Methanosarcina sp.]MDD3874842.1 hypothetical protein [Methanosarcina sp.]MDD4523628.1 hypothetical protein [Methanosarcina sp.]HHV23651.1 hypothetical protein [Methanosarcina sp.]
MNTHIKPEVEHGCFLIFDEKSQILIDTLTPDITGLELHVTCERHKLSVNSQYVSIDNDEAWDLMTGHSENPFDSPLQKKADSVRDTAMYVSQEWQRDEIDILLKHVVLCENLKE